MPGEQAEVVSDQSIEDKLTASFIREENGGKDPREPEPEPEEESPVAEADDAEETTDDAEQTDETTQDDGFEETEFEGKAYKLPKELKEALLRQKDYTQKTQEVAETRRMLEEREQAFQAQSAFSQQHFAKAVEAHTLQQQIQQFSQVDWDKLADENPAEAVKLHHQFTMLRDKFAGVREEMQGLNGQFAQQQAEIRQKAQAQCVQELKKDFPELSMPDRAPQFLKQLDETGRSFGFSGRELEAIADPRMIRVLHAAMQFKKLQASKSVVEKKVQTAKPVQVQAARTSQSNQQTAKLQDLKSRAVKTGSVTDTERFLEAAFSRKKR